MKLKIKITGPRIHDVGYRVFLGKLAMELAMPGFIAYNWNEEGRQEVIALAEGDPARIAILQKRIEEKKPELAEISSIVSEDYDGDIGRTSEFAMFLSFEQLDKAVPILQAVRANTDIIPQMADDIKEIKVDIKAVRKDTDSIPQILEEVKGIREDQPSFAVQLKQLQQDVQAIKAQLGMQ